MEIKIYQIILLLLPSMNMLESQNEPQYKAINVENWTTCDQFLNNTSFNVTSVVDIDWQIFFFWSWLREESYHIKFSIPTTTLIATFRDQLDKDIKPQVNWTEADLFMETSIDFSALLVKSNYSGLYRLIPSLAFEYRDIPTPVFGLKMSKEGYLGIENCKYRFCYGLAPVDKMPQNDRLEEAAKTLKFWGEYNQTFLAVKPVQAPPPEDHFLDDDDEDDDAQVEISNKMAFF